MITIHDTAVFDCAQCYSRKYGAWHRWMTPRLVKRAAKILTVSEFSKSRLLEHFRLPEDRVVVAGNGVDDQFQPASEDEQNRVRADYRLPRQFALTVGTLDPRKNLRGILAAWRMTPGLHELPLAVAGCQVGRFPFRRSRTDSIVRPHAGLCARRSIARTLLCGVGLHFRLAVRGIRTSAAGSDGVRNSDHLCQYDPHCQKSSGMRRYSSIRLVRPASVTP